MTELDRLCVNTLRFLAGHFNRPGHRIIDHHTYGIVSDGDLMEGVSAEAERPSLVIVRSHIGYGSPKQDSPEAHGEPLGPAALRATKERLGWPLEPPFHIPAHQALAQVSPADAGNP